MPAPCSLAKEAKAKKEMLVANEAQKVIREKIAQAERAVSVSGAVLVCMCSVAGCGEGLMQWRLRLAAREGVHRPAAAVCRTIPPNHPFLLLPLLPRVCFTEFTAVLVPYLVFSPIAHTHTPPLQREEALIAQFLSKCAEDDKKDALARQAREEARMVGSGGGDGVFVCASAIG